jgi:hypothetical protein
MDAVLFTDSDPDKGALQAIRDALTSTFSLLDQRVIFRSDPHYDTRYWTEPPADADGTETP